MDKSQTAQTDRLLPEFVELAQKGEASKARLAKLSAGLERHATRAAVILKEFQERLPQMTRAEEQYHNELHALREQTRRWNQAAMVINTKVESLQLQAQVCGWGVYCYDFL